MEKQMEVYKTGGDCMFSGNMAFLSNMHPCPVRIEMYGKTYEFNCSEAAFQAGKCRNEKDVMKLVKAKNGYVAKKIGRRVTMCDGWQNDRIGWMSYVVNQKFTQNPELMEKLLDTYPLKLEETNTWHDTFWGVCGGVGENHLGKILMEIREREFKARVENQPSHEFDILVIRKKQP